MFRATQIGIANQSIIMNRDHFSVIAALQRQLSSGLRFEKVSEAPLDASKVLTLRETLDNLKSDQAQVPLIQRKLNDSVTTLLEVQNIATRAKQIALDAFQHNDIEGNKVLAQEVDGLLQRLELLANAKFDEQYMYSGTRDDVAPFVLQSNESLPIPTVRYVGSENREQIAISASITVATGYPGSEIFFSKDRGATLFFGDTGAAAGTGTDSGVGRSFLDVVHTQTNYLGLSGVKPGTSSVEQDTIVGPPGRHTLTINDTSGTGASGTISLNGGKEYPFTAGDVNLNIIGPRGEQVYVDTTAITAGFNGTIDIESQATISVDGGSSTVDIDFSNNQIVQNDFNGQVTNVNTSEVHQVGRDYVEYSGSADLFTALLELKDDLLSGRDLGKSELSESFNRRALDLERASNRVLEVVGAQSVTLQTVDALSSRQSDQSLALELGISDLQAVDIAQAATELQNRQTLIQANFASLSIIQNLSILNFLG